MFGYISRRQHEIELVETKVQALDTATANLERGLHRNQAVIHELLKQKAALQAQVTTYARTLSAQDDTVRLHLARIEFLQRSLDDATTTTHNWALDRKEALDRIAELEQRERATLKALGESRARYGDLEARLAPADAENIGFVQARVRRLIEVLWASRRTYQHAEEGSLCGVFGHVRGSWEDDVAGIWYCPDCGDEIRLQS